MNADGAAAAYTDIPIEKADEDRLGRAKFAAHIARRIDAASGGPSVVFGLAGPWGSGKSSVLNMIQRELERGPVSWQVRRFTPWAASDTDSLIIEFYATIKDALPEKVWKKVKKTLSPILATAAIGAKPVPSVGGMISGGLQILGKLLDEAKSFDVQFKELSAQLTEVDTRILVIVDDLDRLDANELLTVLKTVRLLGSFPGINYLLAYDHGTITDVLAQTAVANGNSERALEYIEKIVQYPFELPPLRLSHRYRELEAGLAATAASVGVDLRSLEVNNLPITMDFLDQVPETDLMTLRSIHRLVHQFDVTLTLVGAVDVNFLDLLLLTFLRIHYPKLYRQLPRWKADLTPRWERVIWSNDKKPKIDWPKRVDPFLPEGITEKRRTQIMHLLCHMFPAVTNPNENSSQMYLESRDDPDHRRVKNRDYFDRYFEFSVAVEDISDALVLDGLELLALGGTLPNDNEYSVALRDDRRRRTLEVSCNRIRTVGFSTDTAKSAALWLTRVLGLPDRRSAHGSIEARLVADLIAVAIDLATTDQTAAAVIDEYTDEFGLQLATMVIASTSADTQPPFDRDRQQAARENHRQRQLEACIRDLNEDQPLESDGVLFHVNRMDDRTMAALSHYIRSTIETWDDLTRFGARFVGVQEAGDGYQLGQFYAETFRDMVPTAEWPEPEGEFDSTQEIDRSDISLKNRIRVANKVLRINRPG
ncbi:P-loop NTPase fold protein [Nocardia sp. BMG51109]|uniref:KAP family P-loop NTPase fold protein n=1 Tax=Nocardia sp. BMG51109 TaxID=1056816 RepID=UPI0004B8F344|nr:KAP family NTPase [Nocardia sp. BMG51109]